MTARPDLRWTSSISLKRHLDPAVGSKVNAIAKQITRRQGSSTPLTVEITLANPNADLPTDPVACIIS